MPRFDGVPFFQRTYDIIQRSQRTHPTAKYSAEHNGHNHHDQGEKKSRMYFCCTGSKKSRNKNERIKIKKKPYRITECIVPFRFCLDKEKQENEQENTLRDYSQIFVGHAILTKEVIIQSTFLTICHCGLSAIFPAFQKDSRQAGMTDMHLLHTDILYFQFREIHCADTYCCAGFHV